MMRLLITHSLMKCICVIALCCDETLDDESDAVGVIPHLHIVTTNEAFV